MIQRSRWASSASDARRVRIGTTLHLPDRRRLHNQPPRRAAANRRQRLRRGRWSPAAADNGLRRGTMYILPLLQCSFEAWILPIVTPGLRPQTEWKGASIDDKRAF